MLTCHAAAHNTVGMLCIHVMLSVSSNSTFLNFSIK